MTIKEIRDLSSNELDSRSRELKEEIFHLRIQQQSGQLEKPSRLRTLSREIARVATVATQKSSLVSETTKLS